MTDDKILLQFHVRTQVGRKVDALAKATGRTRAGYLRYLTEMHVRAVKNGKLARALHRKESP